MKIITTIIAIVTLCTTVAQSQTLEAYFETAAQNNPGLQAQYKDFEAAMERIPQVRSMPDPTLSFGYFISPVETRVGPQIARFSLNQIFPWFGTLKAKGDATAMMADAKYQTFLESRNKLYYRVATTYYDLYELNQWQRIEQKNIEILESYKTISTSKFKNGLGKMVDVVRVDIILSDAETNLHILEKKEKPLRAQFNQLLNREESEPVAVADTIAILPVAENFRKDSLLINNPVLHSLDLKMAASEYSEKAARKQGLPRMGVGLDYVVVGQRSDMDLPDNGKDALMPMVSVSIPIFRKKYNSAIKEAQLMRESYEFQKEDYSNTLTSGYEMATFEMEQQRELVLLYNQQIEASEQALNLLLKSYSNSGESFEEVLRMQQQLLKYEKLQATATAEYNIALAQLNYLTAKTY